MATRMRTAGRFWNIDLRSAKVSRSSKYEDLHATSPFCFAKHFLRTNENGCTISLTPQWILNHKRSWNSLPKCELYWENATRPRPLAAYHTHLDISSRSVRYAMSVSSDLTLTYNANSLSSSVSTARNQVPQSASCPTAPTAALLDDHSNDSNGEDDNDYEQVHKCVSRPKIQSNTSKPPSATSSTATKTIQTQFPISKKISKLETGFSSFSQ